MFSKAKNFKEMYEAQLEFPEGLGVIGEIPSMEGMDIFWNNTLIICHCKFKSHLTPLILWHPSQTVKLILLFTLTQVCLRTKENKKTYNVRLPTIFRNPFCLFIWSWGNQNSLFPLGPVNKFLT